MSSATRITEVALLFAVLCSAQGPAFEVASVKVTTATNSGSSSSHSDRGQIRFENYSLKRLIETAYGVKDFSFIGPKWLDDERFDIVAKLSPGTDPSQIGAMLQTLLAERFKLEVHHETKAMPALGMVVDKKGLKIRPVAPGDTQTSASRTSFTAKNLSLDGLADRLSNLLNHPVKNLTGLAGVYDIKLEWTLDEDAGAEPNSGKGKASDPGVHIFAAIEDQLGLKLVAQNLPVELLVVDHAERVPTEN